jgi:hypothetical protein
MPNDPAFYAELFSGLEIVWTVVSLAGVIAAIIGFRHARGAMAFLRRHRLNGRRARFTKNQLRLEFGIGVVLAFKTALGVLLIIQPPTESQYHPTFAAWFFFGWMLFESLVLTGLSIWQQVDFYAIRRDLREDLIKAGKFVDEEAEGGF